MSVDEAFVLLKQVTANCSGYFPCDVIFCFMADEICSLNLLRGIDAYVCPVIVFFSYKLKEEAKLSQDLIILLSIGNVPASFFLGLVDKAIENLHSFFFTRGQVFRGTHTSVLVQQCHYCHVHCFGARLTC